MLDMLKGTLADLTVNVIENSTSRRDKDGRHVITNEKLRVWITDFAVDTHRLDLIDAQTEWPHIERKIVRRSLWSYEN